MKKSMLLTVALGLGVFALCAGSAQAGSVPGSGIMNSLHDLSTDDGGYPTGGFDGDKLGRACIYCHAPHHTQKPGVTNDQRSEYTPLWNRPFTQASSFVMYSNGNNPGTGSHNSQAMSDFLANDIKNPGAVSMLCLSCHDGTVGLNVYGSSQMSDASYNPVTNNYAQGTGSIGFADYSNPAPAGATYLGAGTEYNIGGVANSSVVNLSNHHPIGFDYTFAEANDHEIATIDTEFGATGVTIADVLYGDMMECVTCHDVHNSTAGMGEKFLWVTDENNEFCCTCHLKCNNPK